MSCKLICSVCKSPLNKVDNMYKCKSGHSYDIAKEGYVNLMLANNKSSKEPGDNKEMMLARRSFLNSGAYNKLLNEITSILKSYIMEDSVVVENGCGEGFYISNIKSQFPKAECYGFDISKDAIKLACKRTKDVDFFVSSSYNCNIDSKCCDVALVIFAPFVEQELDRILNDCGITLVVRPKQEHLFELKSLFYNDLSPIKNQIYEKFYVYKSINLRYRIYLNHENVIDLLKMTPFYYRVSEEKKQKIESISLNNGIKVEFLIEVLKKIKI